MKTTFIYLGLVALSFNQTIVANELKEQEFNQQKEFKTEVYENILLESKKDTSEQQILYNFDESNSNESAIFDPNTVISSSYKIRVEDVIEENNLITEAKKEIFQPISLERTLEDDIYEYNQIIESNDTNEVYPLDFEKINRSIQCVKVSNNNATIIIDLKL
ncbi:hypothetical protein ACSVH2_12930 [Flavobacterium sp. RSB2_4_14]|uniref:hypothetical protein n=1 Tax=Flavobacterium sp. RSB2_4_14 TaxID=3447665 RepID=UPI003F30371A